MGLQESENDLIVRAQRGDHEAFKRLFERHYGWVFRFIVVKVGEANAADVAQEVMLAVFKCLPRYDVSRASFGTWLRSICANKCADVLRKRRPKQLPVGKSSSEGLDFDWEIEDPNGLLENDDLKQKLLNDVRACLTDLAANQSAGKPIASTVNMVELIRAQYYEGASIDDLTKRFDLPIGTVASRISRGKQRLRTCLEGKSWTTQDIVELLGVIPAPKLSKKGESHEF
jgi:RNA polymerase sigma-70 factor (ECF subfamily)